MAKNEKIEFTDQAQRHIVEADKLDVNGLAVEFLRSVGVDTGTDEQPSRPYILLMALLGNPVKAAVVVLALLLGAFAGDSLVWLSLGACLDLMSWNVTAPGASPGTAMTALDLATIRNGTRKDYGIQIVAAWSKAQAVGWSQIVYPSGNDQTRNIRFRNIANTPTPIFKRGAPCYPRPQDPLTMTQVGSAVAGDIETLHMLVYYEDLIGVDCHLINKAALIKRGQRAITVEDTITPGAATGLYLPNPGRALNAGSDLLKADTLYAVVGANIGIACGVVTLQGTDFGGLRIGVPGRADPDQTEEFFVELSEMHGLPLIPVFNSGNRAGIFQQVVQDENATAVPVSWNLIEIGPSAGEAPVSVATAAS